MTNAGAVPALVRVNEVGVASPDANVKAMFEPLVVVMVLPPLYAVCKLNVELEHSTTSLELLTHNPDPEEVLSPFNCRNEVPPVFTVRLVLPGRLKVAAPFAVKAPETVNAPALVVVMFDEPKVIPAAFVVPIFTVPPVAPTPESIVILPPVPPVPVSAPPRRVKVEPVPVALVPDWMVNGLELAVVISAVWFPARVRTPAVDRLKLVEVNCSVPEPLPIAVLPETDERVVPWVDDRVVNAAVDGVVAPIAVALIPVEVVLKLVEVKVRTLVPADIVEFPRPVMLMLPVVAVRLIAPLERVKPLLAVRSWVTVNAPALVVVIPAAPRVIDEVLPVPIFTVPFVAPFPPLRITFPPVPPVPVSAPAVRLSTPPVPPVPDSVPATRFKAPPSPTAALLVAGSTSRELPPAIVVISG